MDGICSVCGKIMVNESGSCRIRNGRVVEIRCLDCDDELYFGGTKDGKIDKRRSSKDSAQDK